MKKLQKIALGILMISIIFLTTYNSYAAGIWEKGNNFLDKGSNTNGLNISFSNSTTEITNIVDLLFGLGVMIIFISTIIIGIKYMLVNPNEKSRIKQATTPWIIGIVIIFGAATIWRLMIAILEGSIGIGG